MDLDSRKIVAWEIHERMSSDPAARLFYKACLAEGIVAQPLVLRSDNGSPLKGASMLEILSRLGVRSSFNSNYPINGFVTIEDARDRALSFSRWYKTGHKHA